MNPYQKALDNYLKSDGEVEWYDPCEDGHDWKYEADSAGQFRMCIVCEHEEDFNPPCKECGKA